MSLFVFAVALAIIVMGGWVWFLLEPASRMPLPPGAIYARQCGTITDGIRRTTPLASVVVYPGRLEVAAGKINVLPFSEITGVEHRRFLTQRGLFIIHHVKDVPAELVIFTVDSRRLFALLEQQIRMANPSAANDP